jgi:transporter family-2 protein
MERSKLSVFFSIFRNLAALIVSKLHICFYTDLLIFAAENNLIMQNWIFLIMALLAGAALPTQAAVNNKLATVLQQPLLAALISFLVGTVSLILYCLATGVPFRGLMAAKNVTAVAWTGGLLGAYVVTAVILLVPRMGVALTFSLIISGQMLITLVLDHYGLLGVPMRTVNLPRILGVLFIIAGVVLIRRF